MSLLKYLKLLQKRGSSINHILPLKYFTPQDTKTISVLDNRNAMLDTTELQKKRNAFITFIFFDSNRVLTLIFKISYHFWQFESEIYVKKR